MIKKCDVCGADVKINQFGNGRCRKCGWENDKPEYTEMWAVECEKHVRS